VWRLSVEIVIQNEPNKYDQFAFKDIELLMYMVKEYVERKCLVQIEYVAAE